MLALAIAGSTLIVWSTPGIALTDADVVARLVGTLAITGSVLTPILFQDILDAWNPRGSSSGEPIRTQRHRTAAVAVAAVTVAAVAYPAIVLAQGRPRFPSVSECIVPPRAATAVSVVLGYASSYPDALAIKTRSGRAGLAADVEQDGCGRLRVRLHAPVSRAHAEDTLRRAESVGLRPTLELPSG